MNKLTNSYTIHLGHTKAKKWIETVTLNVSKKDYTRFNKAKGTASYNHVVKELIKDYVGTPSGKDAEFWDYNEKL